MKLRHQSSLCPSRLEAHHQQRVAWIHHWNQMGTTENLSKGMESHRCPGTLRAHLAGVLALLNTIHSQWKFQVVAFRPIAERARCPCISLEALAFRSHQ